MATKSPQPKKQLKRLPSSHTVTRDDREANALAWKDKRKSDERLLHANSRLLSRRSLMDEELEQGELEAAIDSQSGSRFTQFSRRASKAIMKSRVFNKIDEISGVSHFMTQGHKKAVTCVGSDFGADCIVTGSEDSTMRVWTFDGIHSSTYILDAIVDHGGAKVTTVACIEALGLVASGTDHGDVFFTDIATQVIDVKKHLHQAPVHDLQIRHAEIETCSITVPIPSQRLGVDFVMRARGLQVTTVRKGDLKKWNEANPSLAVKPNDFITKINGRTLGSLENEEGDRLIKDELKKGQHLQLEVWRCLADVNLIASAGDHFAKVYALKLDTSPYSMNLVCELHHDCKVGMVKFVDQPLDVKDAAWCAQEPRLLTCAEHGTRLWNIRDATLLMHIMDAGYDIEDKARIRDVSVPEQQQSMLISVDNGCISVWDLEKAQQRYEKGLPIEAQRQYDIATHHFQALNSNRFITSSLKGDWVLSVVDKRCIMWNLSPASMCYHCGAWSDLERHLLNHQGEQIQEFMHDATVTALHVFEDPHDGGVLVSGCENGDVMIWDVGSADSGEVLAHLRSLTASEFFSPIILMGVTIMQLSSFAFGPAVPWPLSHKTSERERADVSATRVNVSALSSTGGRAMSFWVSTCSVLAVMILFIAVVAIDLRQRVLDQLNLMKGATPQKDPALQTGSKKNKRRKNTPKSSDASEAQLRMQRILYLQDLLIWSCSSFLVVPMANTLTQAHACEPDTASPGQFVLMIAPEVQCYTGWHSILCTASVVVAPIFFFLLFPYALVHGDANYIQRDEILSFWEWKENATRKATVFHLGPLHPKADNVFVSICAELSAKIALPIVVTLTQDDPLKQMSIVTSIVVMLFVTTLIWSPMLERTWNTIILGMRLWVVCTMACALMACVLDSPERLEPLYALGGSSALVSVMTLGFVLLYAKPTHNHVHTVRIKTSDAREVREVSGIYMP